MASVSYSSPLSLTVDGQETSSSLPAGACLHFGSVIEVAEGSSVPKVVTPPPVSHKERCLRLRLSNGYEFKYTLPVSISLDLYNDVVNYCNVRYDCGR